MSHHSKNAFTLIELLVVISIIMLLVSLLVTMAGPIRQQMMGRKTSATMQTVLSLMSRQSAEFGGSITVAEHPFAGSLAPRLTFQRRDGTQVKTQGEALIGVLANQLTDKTVAGDRLLLSDDCFSDAVCPMLFGMPRRSLGILGAPRVPITGYRRLTPMTSGGMILSTAASTFVVAPTAGTAEHDRAVNMTLGEDAMKSLRSDGVLWTPPDEASLGVDNRVWIGEFPTTSNRPGSKALIGGALTGYRIRGAAIYDAWGREILFESLPGGQLRLISAGRDGAFRFHPGADGVMQTAAHASAPAGDDRDGALDNLASMPEPHP